MSTAWRLLKFAVKLPIALVYNPFYGTVVFLDNMIDELED